MTEGERGFGRSVPHLIKTVLGAFLLTLILMGILAALICFTPLSEEIVTPSVFVLNYLSVFMAGLFSAVKGRQRGFLTGAAAGGLYMMLLYLLGFILFGGIEFTTDTVLQIIYCTLTGMIGGIVGINLSRR